MRALERFFLFMNKLTDLIILNLLFFITCIPIVTVGASCTALCQSTLRLADNTESYIVRGYFAEWKKNLKQGTLIWIPSLALLALCVFNLSVLPAMPQSFYRTAAFCIQVLILFILYGSLLHSFFLPEVYRQTARSTCKNALYMTFKYLPYTFLNLCISALPITLALILPKAAGLILSVFIVMGWSVTAYTQAVLFNRLIKI